MTATSAAPHPQSLLMSLVGLHLLDTDRPLSGTSVVVVLGHLGVAEPATRSVLQRMTTRGLIARHKEGRRTYYSPTPLGRTILADGRAKMFHRWRDGAWDGRWTFVGLTVPERRRALRHRVSSRLTWAGFARIPGGMWVAPGHHDVRAILGGETGESGGPGASGDSGTVAETAPVVVYGLPCPPTTDAQLVEAFDLATVAAGFRRFCADWSGPVTAGPGAVDSIDAVDALVLRLRLHEEWLAQTRTDPQLPGSLLPDDWPGTVAGDLFRARDRELAELERPVLEDFFAGTLARVPRPAGR